MPQRGARHSNSAPSAPQHGERPAPYMHPNQPPGEAVMQRDGHGPAPWGYTAPPAAQLNGFAGPAHAAHGYYQHQQTPYPPVAQPIPAWPGVHQGSPVPGSAAHAASNEEDYYLHLAIEQSLAEQRMAASRTGLSQSSTGSRPLPQTPRDVSNKSVAESLSYKYWSNGFLAHSDQVLDGFYITDDFPEVCEANEFPKLEDLQRVVVLEDDPREVIYVDTKQDPILEQLKDRAREAVQASKPRSNDSTQDKGHKIEAVAKIVAEYFGGSFDSEEGLTAVWRHTSASEKKFKGSVVLPLGRLRGGGASRHRSLLFKILADSQGIKCQLLTGRNLGLGFPDDAAMAQVMINGKYCIVDLVHQPGRLIPCDELQGSSLSRHGTQGSISSGNLQVASGGSGISVGAGAGAGAGAGVGSQPSSSFSEAAAGFSRPKAQSESNLQATPPPAPAPASVRVAQLAVPDLIRLDSGPLPEAIDVSWAKFPSVSSPIAGASSGPSGVPSVATAPSNLVCSGTANSTPAAAPTGTPTCHHGHSQSFDLGSLDFSTYQLSVTPPGQAAQAGQRPAGKPQIASPFAAPSGSTGGAPAVSAARQGQGHGQHAPQSHGGQPFPMQGQPQLHGAQNPAHTHPHMAHQPHMQPHLQPHPHFQPHPQQHNGGGGAVSHWVMNQVQGITHGISQQVQGLTDQISATSSRAVQGLSSVFTAQGQQQHQQQHQQHQHQHQQPGPSWAMGGTTGNGNTSSPGQGPSGTRHQPSHPAPGHSHSGLAGNKGPSGASKSFAESNEPFADLSPFKSAPLLPGSLPKSLLQQQSQMLSQAQEQGGVARRNTANSPASTTSDGGRAWPPEQAQGGAGARPVQHMHTQSNGSNAGWELQGEGSGAAASAQGATPARSSSEQQQQQQQQHSPQMNGAAAAGSTGTGSGGLPATAAPAAPRASAFSAFAVPAAAPAGLQASPFGAGAGSGPGSGSGPGLTMGAPSWMYAPGAAPAVAAAAGTGAGISPWGQAAMQVGSPAQSGTPQAAQAAQATAEEQEASDSKDQLVARLGSLRLQSKDWEIDPKELKFGTRIGHGSYGEVFKGEWRLTDVAIKKFMQQSLSKSVVKEFKTEVSIMYTLKHPNIVLFMGAVVQPEQLAIVTQFIARGSLFNQLHQCPQCNKLTVDAMNSKRRLTIARDIAKGMHYLHSCTPPIVHRDLKSANLLVDKDWTIKVCDFGLSQVKRAAFLTAKSEMGGTAEWMAPEVLRSEAVNEKADVFSYGVILYELVTGEKPWSHCLNRAQVIGAVGYNKQRLELPTDLHPQVVQLINDCWNEAPELRPSFAEVLERLASLRELVPSPTRLAAAREDDLSNCANH